MKRAGFTIVELLVVIVIIAILAGVTVMAYTGIREKAYASKVETDTQQLIKAIRVARESTQKTLMQLTGYNHTAGTCREASTIPDGTDLLTLPSTHNCWAAYRAALNTISNASGINVRNLLDPWGWPYAIDENEGESGGCGRDAVAVFARPLNSYAAGAYDSYPVYDAKYGTISIPRTGFTGCAAD